MRPTSLILASAAVPLPAWLVLHGCSTRAQREEMERRTQGLPPTTRRVFLDAVGGWSAYLATQQLLALQVATVSVQARRALRFSLGYTMAPGLLPRREYAAFQRLRRVVSPHHTDMQLAQPGERYDYGICQN